MSRYHMKAEWAAHEAVWIGFPSHTELWLDDLAAAQAEVLAFARAVHCDGAGERVVLVVDNEGAAAVARDEVGTAAEIVVQPFGDIWLRDTGAIIVHDDAGRRSALHHKVNGWGGKYELEHDDSIGARLAANSGLHVTECDWILEGGALDVDGAGLGVTTEQCLLNPNRNPHLDRADIEARLRDELGIERLLWLGEGLLNDHTDGHVDNIARFVAPGVLAIPVPADDDPNASVYTDARHRARAFGVKLVDMPSVGCLEVHEGAPLPASHMNFFISNAAVIVPTYGGPSDGAAVAAIAKLFPNRKTIGLAANALLTGGGAFHCISQQVPS